MRSEVRRYTLGRRTTKEKVSRRQGFEWRRDIVLRQQEDGVGCDDVSTGSYLRQT